MSRWDSLISSVSFSTSAFDQESIDKDLEGLDVEKLKKKTKRDEL
jgi:hypothetical protein